MSQNKTERPWEMVVRVNRQHAAQWAEQDRRFWDDAAKQTRSR